MILIAPDKFKGTYTAPQIAMHLARALRSAGYDGPIVQRPLSDGGEGSETLMPGCREVAPGVYERNGERLAVSSRLVGFDAFRDTGIGLMHRSSVALGEAIEPGIPTYIAVGGTAVCDGGAGFLQGLGVKFYDSSDRLIDTPLTPATLARVARADTSSLSRYDLRGIVDVRAQLCSGQLSALDFARQKALPSEDLSALPGALASLQRVLGGRSEWDGAGGGLGYALASVCGAPCMSGAEYAAQSLGPLVGSEIDLVITGEGCVDSQTALGGKLVHAVHARAQSAGIPVLVVCGCIKPPVPYALVATIYDNWPEIALEMVNCK